MQLTMPCYSLCLQLGIAATVIALNATRLYTSNGCYLGATDTGFNLCNYAYAVGALSILATLVLAILQVRDVLQQAQHDACMCAYVYM